MSEKSVFEKLVGPLTIGKLLRAYRTANDMTAAELERRLRLTKGSVSLIENGKKKLTLKEMVKLARKLEESEDLYVLAWLKQQARDAGLDPERFLRSPGET
jgi:transcriptional regulator with XRE-family HTH domain